MSRAALITSLLALASGVVAAQPKDVPRRSPAIATALSAAGTIVPTGLLAIGIAAPCTNCTAQAVGFGTAGGVGLLVGPSLGHLYGEHRWWTTGMKIRAAGFAFGVADAIYAAADRGGGNGLGALMLAVPIGGVLLTGAIVDIVTAPRATARYNAETGLASLSFGPMPIRTANNSVATGVGVTGAF